MGEVARDSDRPKHRVELIDERVSGLDTDGIEEATDPDAVAAPHMPGPKRRFAQLMKVGEAPFLQHPVYTGEQPKTKAEGRVAGFNKRFAGFVGNKGA